MRLIEIIDALKQGKKITYDGWGKDEYVYLKNNEIYDEDNKLVGTDCLRYSECGYSIYQEPTQTLQLEQKENLTFAEALQLLQQGKAIKISCWKSNSYNHPCVFLTARYGLDETTRYDSLTVITMQGKRYDWIPNQQEMLEAKWRVIE